MTKENLASKTILLGLSVNNIGKMKVYHPASYF